MATWGPAEIRTNKGEGSHHTHTLTRLWWPVQEEVFPFALEKYICGASTYIYHEYVEPLPKHGVLHVRVPLQYRCTRSSRLSPGLVFALPEPVSFLTGQ